MTTNIVYFTRSNETKEIAEQLASQLDAKAYRITDDRDWSGFGGLIKGLIAAVKNIRVKIDVDNQATEAEQLIILSPLWLNGPVPAVKTFMDQLSDKEVHVVLTNHASPIEKDLVKTSKEYKMVKAAYGITKNKNNRETVIGNIVAAVQ